AAVEAQRQMAVAFAERVLELVPVAPPLRRGLGRLELEPIELAEAAQGRVDLVALLVELALVWQPLPGRPRTGLAVAEAPIRHAIRAGVDQLDGLRLREVPLRLGQPGPDPVARQRPRDEDDV